VESVEPNTGPPLRDLHGIAGTRPPLHRRAPETFAWKTMLEDGETLYAQIKSVSNQPGHATLPEFCSGVLADIGTGAVGRLVVDLRHNSGGSRELLLPFVEGLAGLDRINQPDRLFVVVGHETFSAALWAALDFVNRTRATLVGEPSGGRPNFYGETRSAETPAHHVPFTWASRMNGRTDRGGQSESLAPAIVVRERFADYVAGRDPVLDRVLRQMAPDSLQPERSVAGQVLTSVGDPPIRIRVEESFKYVGGQRFVLRGTVDAEQHFFVEANDQKAIRRMYWIQFERFLPGRSGPYSYDADRPVILSGLELRAHVRRFAEPPAPDSDRRRAYEYLELAGYAVPTPATRARLVYLPGESRRQEVMIVYLEPAITGTELTEQESASILRRALAGVSIVG
jgi:hypothetical protein